jgi:hypothetical protein
MEIKVSIADDLVKQITASPNRAAAAEVAKRIHFATTEGILELPPAEEYLPQLVDVWVTLVRDKFELPPPVMFQEWGSEDSIWGVHVFLSWDGAETSTVYRTALGELEHWM